MRNESQKQIRRIAAIELSNHCNMRCAQCPQGKVKINKGFMSREILLQCVKYAQDYTELNWRGEATMHPNLIEFVKLAKRLKPNLNLGFHTNGRLLTHRLFEGLVENGLNWIHVSLHDKKSCNILKQMEKWNAVLGSPLLIYGEVDTTEEELMARVEGLSDSQIRRVHIANWAGELTNYQVIHEHPEDYARNCQYIRENIFAVSWDGMVNGCCWDWDQVHCLGHVSEFEKIQHRPVYDKCRYCIWSPSVEWTNHLSRPEVVSSYKGYNIVRYRDLLFAVPWHLGQVDLTSEEDLRREGILAAPTVEQVTYVIDRVVDSSPSVYFEGGAPADRLQG